MALALMFINRQRTEEALDTSSPGFSTASRGPSGDDLASLPSDALPRQAVFAAHADNSANGGIVGEAMTTRQARNNAVAGSPLEQPAAPPALPGQEVNLPPRQVASAMQAQARHGGTVYGNGGWPVAPGGNPGAPPPIAVPPGMQPAYTPTPAPVYATPRPAPVWQPVQTNFGSNSLASVAGAYAGTQAQTTALNPAAGLYPTYPVPSDAWRANARTFPLPAGPGAQASQAAPAMTPDQTLLRASATQTPPQLYSTPVAVEPAGGPWGGDASLAAALQPAPSLGKETDPSGNDLLPIYTPAVAPRPSALNASTPAPTPSPAQQAMMAAAQVTPAQREDFAIEKGNSVVAFNNVSPGQARPNATAARHDVKDAIAALRDAANKVSPVTGTPADGVTAVPTLVPALIRPDGASPAPTPINYARGEASPQGAGKVSPELFSAGTDTLKQLAESPLGSNVAARVGERELTTRDANKRVDALLQLQKRKVDEDRRLMLQRLIAEEWAEKTAIAQFATQQGISVSDEEVREFTARMRQRVGNMEEALKSAGFSADEIYREMRDSALCEKLVEQRLEKYDDSRLRQVYQSDPGRFEPSRRLHLQEIVKKKPSSPEEARKVKQEMVSLRERLARGEEFARIATRSSEAPSRANGGDLGWIDDRNAERISEEMARGLEGVKPGQVTDVVETDDSFAIYRLAEVEEPKPGFEGARERVMDVVREKERNIAYEQAGKSMVVALAHMQKKLGTVKVVSSGASTPARTPARPAPPEPNRSADKDGVVRRSAALQDPAPGLSAEDPQMAMDPAMGLDEALSPSAEETERRGLLSRLGGIFGGRDRDRQPQQQQQVQQPPSPAPQSEPRRRQEASARPASPSAPAVSPRASEPPPAPEADAPPGFGGPTQPASGEEPAREGRIRSFFSNFRR